MSDNERRGNKRKSRDKDKNLSRRGRVESRRQPSTMTRSISPLPSCSYRTPDPQWSRHPVVLTVASSDDSAGEQSRQTLPTPAPAPWLQSSESTALSLLPTQSTSLSLQPTQSTSLSLQPTQSTALSLPSQSTALSLRSAQPTRRRRKRKCSSRRSRSSRTNKMLDFIKNQIQELKQSIDSYAAQSSYDSSLPVELSSDSSTDDTSIVPREILQSLIEEEALPLNQPNTEDQYPENTTQQIEMLRSTEIQFAGPMSFTRLQQTLGVCYTRSQVLPLVPGIEEDQETSDLQSQPEPLELGQHQEALRLLQQQHQQHQHQQHQQHQQNQQQQQYQQHQQHQEHQEHQFCLTQKPPWLDQRLGTAEATEQHRLNLPSQEMIPEPKQEPEPEYVLSEPEEQQQVRKFWHIPQQHQFEPEQELQQPSQAQRLEPLVNEPLQPGTEQPLQSQGYQPWLQSQPLNPGQQLQQFNQQQWLQSMSHWQRFQPRLQQPRGYEQWQQSFDPHQRLQYYSHEQWLQSMNHWQRLPFPSHVQHLPFMSYEQWLASFGPSLGHHVQPLTHRPQHLPFVNELRHTQLLRPELSTQPLSQLPASLPEHQLGLLSSSPQRPLSLLEQNANQTQLVALDLSRDPVSINRLNMPRVSKRSFSKNTYTGGG